MDNEKKNLKAIRKQKMKEMWSWPHYFLLAFVCFVLRTKFNAHTVKSKSFREQKKNGAMLVLCNHTSALDFAYFTQPFFYKKVSFVVAENMMYSTPIFAKVIKGYHAITKKQYFADYTCMKNMKRYLENGISVIICPEGKVSAEGKTGVMPVSIARLIKWLGYPVGTVLTKGAGLTRPKWAHTTRRGKVTCYCDMLMTAEETQSLGKDEIFAKIENALDHNEHIYQLETGIEYKGKRYAEGLERMLYHCPKCGAEFKMTARENTLKCGECGNEVYVPNTGGLVPIGDSVCPERIDVWYENERELVAKEVQNPDFSIEKPVHLFLENDTKNGYRFVTTGNLLLDRENIEFTATSDVRPLNSTSEYKIGDMSYDIDLNGETEAVEQEFLKLSFAVKNFVTIANIPGSILDVYNGKHTFRFVFCGELAATKYALAIEEMAKQRGENE